MVGRIDLMPTLNIKDPEVYRLAAMLAERRHTSMTAVVREALEESETHDRPRQKASVEEILEIARKAREEMAAVGARFLTDDDLYDERGLPR